jgi:hypothetical protein
LYGALRFQHFSFVAIPAPRPEEPLHPVASTPWNYVHMEVRDALAHAVVDGDERSFRAQPSFHCSSDVLCGAEHWDQKVRRQVGQQFVMLFRTHETMPREQWAVVKKYRYLLVFINVACIHSTSDDPAENA